MRMKQRARRGYTLAELEEVWDRWKTRGVAKVDWTSVW